ncbi:MAG: hypothetical protein JSV23_03490 [Promethearchaeota archaeon]|nr:MAG: hypothetical protein JSV23_03490 [Candidatus Lokiarchaeota archaeon]
MHFLKKIVESPILDDPAKNHKNVHRHFYRYSKGDFIGPAMRISQTKAKLTLKGSHEYEDLILEIVTSGISDPEEYFEIKGRLITGIDVSEDLNKFGLNWNLKQSTGQTKNYIAEIVDNIKKETLLKSIQKFRENSYLLLSYTINPTCKIKTKKNIPQPSKKQVEEDDVSKRIQFCTGYISNREKNLKLTLEASLSDFKSELPKNWKAITIFNNYKITDIEIPKNIKNSRLLRIMATRKGKLVRTVDIDGEIIEKQYTIVV